jgi:HEAT repeat protein
VPTGPQTDPTGRLIPNPRGRRSSTSHSWRVWWEYNRNYVVGLRRRIRTAGAGTVTGPRREDGVDPLGDRRPAVLAALRDLVDAPRTHDKLKSACLIALGRLGGDADVERFVRSLGHTEGDDVRAAAALGLGLLPPLESDGARGDLKAAFDAAIRNGTARVRGFAYVGAAMRARHDPAAAMDVARYVRDLDDSYDAASLAFACGVTRDAVLLPELLIAVRRGELGGKSLDDNARAHAAAGLGLLRAPMAADLLVKVLRSRKVGIEARRAAVLALGRILREVELDEGARKSAERALLDTADKCNDPVAVGFAYVALGGAREPEGAARMMRDIDHGGDMIVKTYAALGLGLAAPRLSESQARKVHSFLVEELDKTHDPELGSSLAIAIGLAGAERGAEALRERVAEQRRPGPLRGSCAEALGLLEDKHPDTADLLVESLQDSSPSLVEGAAMGLGLLGKHGVVRQMVDRLKSSSVDTVQARLTLALGYLGQSTAVDPLLEILVDERESRAVRDLAAVALGLLGSSPEDDPLSEIDAYYDYFATTVVTFELLTII